MAAESGSSEQTAGDDNPVASKVAVYRQSWVAYVYPVCWRLILILTGVWLTNYSWMVGAIVVAVFTVGMGLKIIYIAKTRLRIDGDGVWIHSGIFPWNRGIRGIKWRDVEDASFSTGFIGWLLKSRLVFIGHRSNKIGTLFLNHVKHGDQAVMHINNLHIKMLENVAS